MNNSSRTPEEVPSHCPLCGAKVELDYSEPAGDACCPHCGTLLWAATKIHSFILKQQTNLKPASGKTFSLNAPLRELGFNSRQLIEFVMELEEEITIEIPDEEYNAITKVDTLRDLIRLLERIIFNHSVSRSIILDPNGLGDATVKLDTV